MGGDEQALQEVRCSRAERRGIEVPKCAWVGDQGGPREATTWMVLEEQERRQERRGLTAPSGARATSPEADPM